MMVESFFTRLLRTARFPSCGHPRAAYNMVALGDGNSTVTRNKNLATFVTT